MSTLLNPPPVTPKLTDRLVQVEPASDWASSTLDALGPVSQVEDQDSSKPSTPGPHVPGAFPGPIYFQPGVAQKNAQYAKKVGIGALQTAKEYVPMSMEDLKHLLENAGDTVGGYLPEMVAAYLPHHTTAHTLLVSETNPQNVPLDSSGEEGNISGPIAHTTANTSIVSKEPSQDAHPDSPGGHTSEHSPTNTPLISEEISPRIHPDSSNGVGTPNSPMDEFGAVTPHGPNSRSETEITTSPEERRQKHLPDPPEKAEAADIWVDALPSDKGGGFLPEEAHGFKSGANTDTDSSTRLLRTELDSLSTKARDQDTSQNALSATGSALFSSLPSIPDENITASSTNLTVPNTTGLTSPLVTDGKNSEGVPLSDKKLGEESLPPTTNIVDGPRNLEQRVSEDTPRNGTITAATSSPVGQSVRKRPGLMDRLKGEVKVISGKLSHKESKVEEGKRMIGKT